jgi:septal ring factor EnvC (AmiA/AmiB activator)
MTKPIINPPLPLKAVSSRYCYWLLRSFNSMAKNVTRDTERLQMMQSNNKELSSAVSRIQSNNKELESTASALESRNRELSSAVSRMQSQISRLKRNRQPPTHDHPNPPPLD